MQSSQNYKETPHKLIKYEQNINYNFSDDKVELSNTISQKNETITPSKNNNTLITGTKISYDNNFTIDHLIKSGNLTPYFSINLSKKNASDISTYISQSIESMDINSLITFNDTIYPQIHSIKAFTIPTITNKIVFKIFIIIILISHPFNHFHGSIPALTYPMKKASAQFQDKKAKLKIVKHTISTNWLTMHFWNLFEPHSGSYHHLNKAFQILTTQKQKKEKITD